MFTGIIEEIGTVRAVRAGRTGAVLDIEASKVLEGTAVGDSIAVNGVCLTVTPGQGHFTADAMPETLRRTSLGSLSAGVEAGSAAISYPATWMPAAGLRLLKRTA